LKGGKARAAKLSAKERKAAAKHAAQARWGKPREKSVKQTLRELQKKMSAAFDLAELNGDWSAFEEMERQETELRAKLDLRIA